MQCALENLERAAFPLKHPVKMEVELAVAGTNQRWAADRVRLLDFV